MFGDEGLYSVECGVGGQVADRLPEQLVTAGEIADGDEAGIDAIDTGSGSVEVDGPDCSGTRPLEDVDRDLMLHPPDPAVTSDEIFDGGAGQLGKHVPEVGDAETGTEFAESVDQVIAVFATTELGGATERYGCEPIVPVGGPPVPVGPFGQSEEPCDSVP